MPAQISIATLQTALTQITPLQREATIQLSPDGITIRTTAPSKRATVTVRLSAAAFESSPDIKDHIGLNVTLPLRFLKLLPSQSTVTIDFDRRHEYLHLLGEQYRTSRLTVGVIDPKTILKQPQAASHLPGAVEIASGSTDMDRALTAADLCGELVDLMIDPGESGFCVRASGDLDSMREEFPGEDSTILRANPAHTTVPVDYLVRTYEAIPDDGRPVRLAFGEGTSVRMSTTMADGDGEITVVLFPDVDKD